MSALRIGARIKYQIQTDIEEAKRLLSERTQGNEAPQKRAEALRQRASKLLYKAQRSSDDINGAFLLRSYV